MKSFKKTKAHALTEDQRELVRARFGSAVLPETTLVSYDGLCVAIEHLDLEAFIDLNPNMPSMLIGFGELRA